MRCANHADRPAVGVCVSCRKVVCGGCTTRLQGRNFCVECLERRAASKPTDAPARSSSAGRVGMVMLAGASVFLLVGSLWGAGFLLYLIG